MREQWARRIALLTGQMIFLMATLFALSQNPIEPGNTKPGNTKPSNTKVSDEQLITTEPITTKALNAQAIKAGFLIYQQQACARCHSIAGEGNPRNPLDGVGARHEQQALRKWIIGADELQTIMPARAFKTKQAYKNLELRQ